MPAAILERATLRTSRLLDFASEKELVAQTGHQRSAWPLVVLKELVDNAIDSCEETGISPVVSIKVDHSGITVEDNGPGLPLETIKHVLDFSVRVSSREAYVSPTRGAQGNALKTIVAMPFVIDGERGHIEIETGEVRHLIDMTVDRIRQELMISHEIEAIKRRIGTLVRVRWPYLPSANGDETRARFLQFALDYSWLNPHLTIKAEWFGKGVSAAATDPAWVKWNPSDPTSAHWYAPQHLERLVAGYISNGREITIRELVSEFRGLAGTAKQKAVLEATGLSREPITCMVNGNDLDRSLVDRLLVAMQANSKPVKPAMLGTIGRDHFHARFAAIDGEMESFNYCKVTDTTDGIPWIIETAFCWCPKLLRRRLVTGVNWSPSIINPFRELGSFGQSLDSILTQQRADRDEPVIMVLHMSCPRVEYTDRGKSAVVTK
jgi:DNA topoisomerase VI subunit B